MKKLFVFVLLAVATLTQAQRFEWAKGYSVESGSYRSIVGRVTDSLGNMYILGNCDATSVWDGTEDIIPSIHKSTKNLLNAVLIAKISPDGEMVWKKVIFGNNSNSCIPHDIKKIGDTAFACLVDFTMPTSANYCYYLDTFMYGWGDYPVSLTASTTSMARFTALITFDFYGDVIEQHFLQVSYIDTMGNDYRNTPDRPIQKDFLHEPKFDIDGNGNIYICRIAQDHFDNEISVEEGTAIGLKFWVDQRFAGEYYLNDGFHPRWSYQILKFSPHFDTLLACRYVFQKSDSIGSYTQEAINKAYIQADSTGNVYFRCTLEPAGIYNSSKTLVIDSLSGISFSHTEKNWIISCLVKYDSTLNAKWVISFNDSVINRNGFLSQVFSDFDADSNLLFLYAVTGRSSYRDTVNLYSILTYNGEPLNLKSDVFFCAFENGDVNPPTLHSYGKVPGTYLSANNVKGTCKNNRVFLQSQYGGGITFPSQTITHGTYEDGYALTVFDYSGRVIDGIDYGIVASNVSHYAGPTVLHDSVLYLCTLLKTSAQFGDISFPVYGETNVIAKYVDTAFMHLYVRPTLGTSNVSAVAPRVYPVPATDRLHFDCPAGGVPTAVAAISLSGWRMPLTATASSADVSCLAPGVYILEITTAKDKYYTKFIKVRGER